MKRKAITVLTLILLLVQLAFDVAAVFMSVSDSIVTSTYAPTSVVVAVITVLFMIWGSDFPKYTFLPTFCLFIGIPCLEFATTLSVPFKKRFFPFLLTLFHIISTAACFVLLFLFIRRGVQESFSEDIVKVILLLIYKAVCSALTTLLLVAYFKNRQIALQEKREMELFTGASSNG